MSGKPLFPHLFSPFRLRNLELRNRIVSTGHSTGLTDAGRVGDRLIAYYQARARGGAALMITGSTSVHPTSTSKLGQALSNWDDAVAALTDEGVDLRDVVSGRRTSLPDVVTVVASSGGVARRQMLPALRTLMPGISVTCVGDAVSTRTIEKAIYEGHMAARAI